MQIHFTQETKAGFARLEKCLSEPLRVWPNESVCIYCNVSSETYSKWYCRRWRHACILRSNMSMTLAHSFSKIQYYFCDCSYLFSIYLRGLFWNNFLFYETSQQIQVWSV